LLTYPTGRSSSRLERVAVGVGYAAAVITPVWGSEAATIVLAGLLVAVGAVGYARSVGRLRRARRAALQATIALGVVLAGGAAARLAAPDGNAIYPASLVYHATLCAIGVGLLVDLLSAPWERAAVTDLVVELGEGRSSPLRDALAAALGDPSLELGYWLPEARGYADAQGRPLPLPRPGSSRSVTVVERHGRPVAALVHDPVVLDDPGLLDAIAAAAQLTAVNVRLQAEVRAQLEELRASRRRILDSADEERLRLERALHDGAERRLVSLRELLRSARAETRSEATEHRIDHAEAQLGQTLDELGRLAHGLHPRALAERGLRAALVSLAEAAPLPVSVTVTGRPLPPGIDAAAYFVAAEGLTNIAKHASASRAVVTLTADEDAARIEVADDGAGGAELAGGTGLRGLADRVEALGGGLTIESRPGSGTRLRAEIPLGSSRTLGGADPQAAQPMASHG
jgi:signal transduction histidine kinase